MTDYHKYEEWKHKFYAAVAENVPEHAGQPTSDIGGFEGVSFHVAADYGKVGDDGGVIVAIALGDADRFGQRRHTQLVASWRKDDPADVARLAVAKYVHVRHQYL